MSVSRLVLTLSVLLFLALTVSAQNGPQTYCSPVTVDAFQVVSSSNNAEGSLLNAINGTYPTQLYNVLLPVQYNLSTIWFNIFLTSNATTGSTAGTVGVTFTISLNGAVKNTSTGTPQVYSPDPITGMADVQFNNWGSSPRSNVTNTLMLNVSETITVGQDVTYCFYVYTILYVNPVPTPGTGGNNATVSSSASFIRGDPQFVGLRGQSFQVHGVDGAVYNLISDASMQLNSRFTFLEGPRPCPVMPSTGKVSAACWSHPGSYLSELALKTIGGSQVLVVSGDAATGYASITVDGKALKVGDEVTLNFGKSGLTGSLTVDNAFELTLHAGHYNLVVENNDGFVNLRSVSVLPTSWSKLASHGLLGQTWQNKRYSGKVKYIEGDVDDYLIEDDNMFGDAFLYNRFTQ